MTMGLIMVGAIAANKPDVTLDEVTPLARLTTDNQVIVVPADSDIKDVDDLTALMKKDLPSVSIAGGSAGGVEQILAGLIAQALDQDPADVNYIAHAGGGEAIATLLSGSATMGVSGISEVKPQIDAGSLRPIAVSSEERVDLLPDVPTLKEEGVDVVVTNWRGVVAPPGISKEQEQKLEDLIMEMTETDEWQEALKREGWGDVALAGPEFEELPRGRDRAHQQGRRRPRDRGGLMSPNTGDRHEPVNVRGQIVGAEDAEQLHIENDRRTALATMLLGALMLVIAIIVLVQATQLDNRGATVGPATGPWVIGACCSSRRC